MRPERLGLRHPRFVLRHLLLGGAPAAERVSPRRVPSPPRWLLPLALIACQPHLEETEDLGLRRLEGFVTTGIDGFQEVDIDVNDEESLAIIAEAVDPGARVYIRRLIDPEGTVVYRAEDWFSPVNEQMTNAGFLAPVSTLNWPVLSTDFLIVPGRWKAVVGLANDNDALIQGDVGVDVLLKNDPDLFTGRVRVVIVRPKGRQLQAVLDEAKRIWVDMFEPLRIGIDFDDVVFDEVATGVVDPSPPTMGDVRYDVLAQANGIRTVSVVLTDFIDAPELGVGNQLAGLSGGIPGAWVPTPYSAVQVSLLAAAGADGQFDAQEIRLFAETMAHETGHYLGLFHPVEAFSEAPWSTFDAVSDTPRCTSDTECFWALGGNLMFPFPVCDLSGACDRQDQLSDGQVAVIQRSVGVD